MSRCLEELRIACRTLVAAPFTSGVAVIVLALGSGVNIAVFAVFQGILLDPLPYRAAPRLVILSIATPDGADFALPEDEIDEWRERLRTVESVAGYATDERTLRGPGEPIAVTAAHVTDAFFDVLGVPPLRGQLDAFGSAPGAAVLSATLADRLEQAAAESTRPSDFTLGDRAWEIAAIMPAEFSFPSERVDIWLPARPAGTVEGQERAVAPERFHLVARAREGVTPKQISDDMARVLFELRAIEAGADSARPMVTPLTDAAIGGLRPVLAAALAGALLVLLVTCGNVAMLLLGRAAERRRESAVRLALGAGRFQVARVSLLESLVLTAAGAVCGLGLAAILLAALRSFGAGILPRLAAISIDGSVLVAGLAMIIGMAILCALAPALRMARQEPAALLGGDRGMGAGGARRPLAILVVAQIGASVVLLSGAALLGQTVLRLLAAETSIEPAGVLSTELARGHADGAGGDDAIRSAAFVRDVLEQVRALPGVEAAGIGSHSPPHILPFQFFVRYRTAARQDYLRMSAVSITPGFLEALGIRVVAGGAMATSGGLTAGEGVLLSETAARFYGGDRDLVGRELPVRLPPFVSFEAPPRVIGVVPDIRYAGLDQPANAAVYVPWSARPTGTSYLAVKAPGAPEALKAAIQRILRQADPTMPIPPIRTLGDEMARSIGDRRLRVLTALGFAGVALGVALGGIGALFLRAVAERRRELAIRLACGASGSRLTGMMLRRAALLTGLGAVLGLALTLALGRGLDHLLYGVAPHDPPTLVAAVAVVGSAALLAAWIPARRAARIEPGELLREG